MFSSWQEFLEKVYQVLEEPGYPKLVGNLGNPHPSMVLGNSGSGLNSHKVLLGRLQLSRENYGTTNFNEKDKQFFQKTVPNPLQNPDPLRRGRFGTAGQPTLCRRRQAQGVSR
jgi:hypothetical protein